VHIFYTFINIVIFIYTENKLNANFGQEGGKRKRAQSHGGDNVISTECLTVVFIHNL